MNARTKLVAPALGLALVAALGTTACTPKAQTASQPTAAQQAAAQQAADQAAAQQQAAQQQAAQEQASKPDPKAPKGMKDVTKLVIKDLKVGTGKTAKVGTTVSVHYTGWLTSGVKFDSSVDRGQPFDFKLGAGEVIQGWDQGVAGMKVGGKRRITIPSDLGYGASGAGGVIPPNATLVFDVELLAVK